MDERQAMAYAIELAWRGWGRVAPNPMVGAVVLRGNEVVGEGWHAEFGERHAEPVALDMAGAGARGATLVVTLEPCTHQGRQPPCVERVLAAGIARVVVALADPNPEAAGGAAVLRQRGVQVECGLMGREVAEQNAAFVTAHRERARPFVALKLATSLDGGIADLAGCSRWISGDEAREWVQWLRAGHDVLAVGGATARVDDPSLTVRGPLQPRRPPLRVVFTRRGEVSPSSSLARTAREVPTVVFASERVGQPANALREAGVQVEEGRDLSDALAALRQRGAQSVLVEGGGKLAGAMLEQDLVDRLYWVQIPLWLGAQGRPAVAGLRSRPLAESPRWKIVERRALGEDTLLVADRT